MVPSTIYAPRSAHEASPYAQSSHAKALESIGGDNLEDLKKSLGDPSLTPESFDKMVHGEIKRRGLTPGSDDAQAVERAMKGYYSTLNPVLRNDSGVVPRWTDLANKNWDNVFASHDARAENPDLPNSGYPLPLIPNSKRLPNDYARSKFTQSADRWSSHVLGRHSSAIAQALPEGMRVNRAVFREKMREIQNSKEGSAYLKEIQHDPAAMQDFITKMAVESAYTPEKIGTKDDPMFAGATERRKKRKGDAAARAVLAYRIASGAVSPEELQKMAGKGLIPSGTLRKARAMAMDEQRKVRQGRLRPGQMGRFSDAEMKKQALAMQERMKAMEVQGQALQAWGQQVMAAWAAAAKWMETNPGEPLPANLRKILDGGMPRLNPNFGRSAGPEEPAGPEVPSTVTGGASPDGEVRGGFGGGGQEGPDEMFMRPKTAPEAAVPEVTGDLGKDVAAVRAWSTQNSQPMPRGDKDFAEIEKWAQEVLMAPTNLGGLGYDQASALAFLAHAYPDKYDPHRTSERNPFGRRTYKSWFKRIPWTSPSPYLGPVGIY